ncbi:hypothetical protein [Anoxynatronum sibiricum]|uniref:Uncharacterized protein n=1 Tax=Anoxynatronum sibiricum TaxID=210623 RepID=A0ABU9VT78_9CLOT
MRMEYGIAALFGTFFLFFFLIAIASYVLAALGLYTMAQKRNIENPWVAWIPVAQLYILGKVIRTLNIGGYEVPQVELVLPGIAIASAVLGMIPLIGTVISIAAAVVSLFALHKLYKLHRPDQAVLYLLLSIIIPFMGPVFIFLMRNDAPVFEEV